MRIIAGEWGGQSLQGRPHPKLRPTSDKVKEAVFDILEARFVKSWGQVEVLDLFAGLGGLGLEALSRGAQRAVFVDHHLLTSQQISANIKLFQAEARSEVLCRGVLETIRWLSARGDRFDLIFMDPPYREDWVLACLNTMVDHPLLKKRGLVVAEHDKRESLSAAQGLWALEDSRRYGDTSISLLTAKVH